MLTHLFHHVLVNKAKPLVRDGVLVWKLLASVNTATL